MNAAIDDPTPAPFGRMLDARGNRLGLRGDGFGRAKHLAALGAAVHADENGERLSRGPEPLPARVPRL